MLAACAATALLLVGAAALPAAATHHTPADVTYMSCAAVRTTGFLSDTHHTACIGADMRMHHIATDCNNESYNLGGNAPEQRLTHPMFDALCK